MCCALPLAKLHRWPTPRATWPMKKRVSPGARRAIILIHARSIIRLETAFGRCDRKQLTPVESITWQSPVPSRYLPFNPTVPKNCDRRVLFCAREEAGRVIPRNRKGWRVVFGGPSLAPKVARDPTDSHRRPSDARFLAQTLGRLSVSRCLG